MSNVFDFDDLSDDGIDRLIDRSWMKDDRKPQRKPNKPVVTNMTDVTAKELQWLWPERIPLGKVSLFSGDPGLGKSIVTLDIAARVSRGMPWPEVVDEVANDECRIANAE